MKSEAKSGTDRVKPFGSSQVKIEKAQLKISLHRSIVRYTNLSVASGESSVDICQLRVDICQLSVASYLSVAS